ncbi:hypothetical protein EGW08_002246 [Elysia chlorotica]|uniref:Uncharacterized protein n=1 Tax=Elysia chlorotica TaxID=188477 RepID=A0A433U851_ELYCH|nr:hypothetical protein EGW08_002246 [Elysia chlorotica]
MRQVRANLEGLLDVRAGVGFVGPKSPMRGLRFLTKINTTAQSAVQKSLEQASQVLQMLFSTDSAHEDVVQLYWLRVRAHLTSLVAVLAQGESPPHKSGSCIGSGKLRLDSLVLGVGILVMVSALSLSKLRLWGGSAINTRRGAGQRNIFFQTTAQSAVLKSLEQASQVLQMLFSTDSAHGDVVQKSWHPQSVETVEVAPSLQIGDIKLRGKKGELVETERWSHLPSKLQSDKIT